MKNLLNGIVVVALAFSSAHAEEKSAVIEPYYIAQFETTYIISEKGELIPWPGYVALNWRREAFNIGEGFFG